MEAGERLGEAGLSDPVRPGHLERHLLGRMDACLRDLHKHTELVLIRQAKLEPLRSHPQAEERRDVYCRTVT